MLIACRLRRWIKMKPHSHFRSNCSGSTTSIFIKNQAPHSSVTRLETNQEKLQNVTRPDQVKPLGISVWQRLVLNVVSCPVLIAKAIRINPSMGMLHQAIHEDAARDRVLRYSNSCPKDAVILEKLKEVPTKNRRCRIIEVMTDIGRSDRLWDGHTVTSAKHWSPVPSTSRCRLPITGSVLLDWWRQCGAC